MTEARSAGRLSDKIDATVRDHMIDATIEDNQAAAFVALSAIAYSASKLIYMLAGPGKGNLMTRERLRAAFDGILLDAHAFVEKGDEKAANNVGAMIEVVKALREKMPQEERGRLDQLLEGFEKLIEPRDEKNVDDMPKIPKLDSKRPPGSTLN